jgi:hypothetical protein
MLFTEALRYPIRGDRPTDVFAVGGVLGLAAVLLLRGAAAAYPAVLALALAGLAALPMVGLLGYLVRAFASTLDGEDAPPEYGDATGLLRIGNRAFVVSVAYLLVPVTVVLVTVAGALDAPAETLGGGQTLLVLVSSTLTLVVALAFAYVYPAALGAVARGQSLANAFDVRRHRSVLGDVRYFTAWSFALMFAIPGWLLSVGALSSTNVLGVLAVFLAFYAHLAAVRLVATGYRRAAALSGE